jgi:N utilization substance protein B
MPKGNSAYFRRKARVVALQTLYEADVAGHSVDSCFDWLKEESQLPEASSDYALELVDGVVGRREEIDEWIQRFAPAWPVKQLPVIDRNVLRLALLEIRFGRGIPPKVAVNEAVELAKIFGGESSPRFVNGVLGSIMDAIEQASSEELHEAGDTVSQGRK